MSHPKSAVTERASARRARPAPEKGRLIVDPAQINVTEPYNDCTSYRGDEITRTIRRPRLSARLDGSFHLCRLAALLPPVRAASLSRHFTRLLGDAILIDFVKWIDTRRVVISRDMRLRLR